MVHEDEERIAVCGWVCFAAKDDEVNGYREVHYIPKDCILNITELK